MNKLWSFLKDKGVTIGKAADELVTGGRLTDAVREIGDLVGIDAGSPDELLGALKANPELITRLKEQDAELQIRLHEIAAKDRASARRREVDTGDSWTPRGIAIVLGVAFIASYLFLWYHAQTGIDESIRMLFARSQGMLDGLLAAIVTYYFGSSASSQKKTRSLEQIAGLTDSDRR